MGIKIPRQKKRLFLVSLCYRLLKLPVSDKTKLKLFLDLEWIFDRLAHEISFRIYSTHHPIRNCFQEFLINVIDSEDSVLDVGCGVGTVASILAGKVKSVIAIDHDSESIEIAKNRYQKENLTFIQADAREYLQTHKDKFNVLVLSHILEHLDQPEEFLLTFKDYFEHIYIEVPDFDKTPANHYRKELGVDLIYTDNDHVTEFDRHEIKKLFDECNIKVIKSEFAFGIQKYWCKT